jgi:hypothetical protein
VCDSVVSKRNDGFNKFPLRHGWIALGNDCTACEGKFRLLGNYVSNLPVIEQSVTPTIESNSRIARKPVAIVRWIEAAAAAARLACGAPHLRRRRPTPAAGGSSSTRQHQNAQDGLPPFHAPLGGSQPWAGSGPRLKTATREKLGGLAARCGWAGPRAIPPRQAEMRICDKTPVDKPPRVIYSSLTIDDHSFARVGRT